MKNVKLLISVGLIIGMVSCGKKGCMDPMSLAYDSQATKDDGNCTYPANEKRSLVFKATATWCPPCGSWGKDYVDNLYQDFPNGNMEVIGLHNDNDFGVDVANMILGELNNSSYPSFYVGIQSTSTSYTDISNAVDSELDEDNLVSMAVDYSTEAGVMTIKVQSQIVDQSTFSGSDCHLAIYILEDGQVANQQVGNPGSGVDDPNFVHDHILRTEANGSSFGVPITFTDGNNLTEVNATLAPSTIWTHENLYPVAVIWRMNGNNYEFINFAK